MFQVRYHTGGMAFIHFGFGHSFFFNWYLLKSGHVPSSMLDSGDILYRAVMKPKPFAVKGDECYEGVYASGKASLRRSCIFLHIFQ